MYYMFIMQHLCTYSNNYYDVDWNPTMTVTMSEEEVVDSTVDIWLDIDDDRGELFCSDSMGDNVVINVGFVDFQVESGNWKLDEVNARIMIVLIMFWSIRIMLTPFVVESHNSYAMKD